MHPYDYPTGENSYNSRLTETTKTYHRYMVTFPSVPSPSLPQPDIVRGEYFQPCGIDRFPLVILVHGMGDPNIIPCNLIARNLAKKGIASFVLYLVFHSSRMPPDMKRRFPALTAKEWFDTYRLSVINIRQIIDWANGRAEIDKDEIATVGISVGGILSALAMGVDERIRAGVFIISGGNWEEMTWHSWSHSAREKENCGRAECHVIRSQYPKFVAEVAEKGIENVTPIKECFLTDPITFAFRLQNRPVLMINARWDTIIPRQCALDLWEACGQPPILWLPATHLTIYLWYPLLVSRITSFLKSTFNTKDS